MRGQKPVLVVDDDDEIRDLVRRILAEAGYPVLLAATGEDAMGILGQIVPGLVLLDTAMSPINGPAIRSHMATSPALRHVAVISMSAIPAEDADATLSKPFTAAQLLDLVKRLSR